MSCGAQDFEDVNLLIFGCGATSVQGPTSFLLFLGVLWGSLVVVRRTLRRAPS